MRMKCNHIAIKKVSGLNFVTDSKVKESASYTGVQNSNTENCLEKKIKEDVSGILTYKYELIKERPNFYCFWFFNLFIIETFFFRTFSRDPDDPNNECINKENIRKCDKRGIVRNWSVCTEVDFNNGKRYRYCVIKDDQPGKSCVLEEALDKNSQICKLKHFKKVLAELKEKVSFKTQLWISKNKEIQITYSLYVKILSVDRKIDKSSCCWSNMYKIDFSYENHISICNSLKSCKA